MYSVDRWYDHVTSDKKVIERYRYIKNSGEIVQQIERTIFLVY